MRVGPHKVAVEEYIVKPDGSEEVTKRWSSLLDCCMEIGVDYSTIRNRTKSEKGQHTSLGVFKYRRVEAAE